MSCDLYITDLKHKVKMYEAEGLQMTEVSSPGEKWSQEQSHSITLNESLLELVSSAFFIPLNYRLAPSIPSLASV